MDSEYLHGIDCVSGGGFDFSGVSPWINMLTQAAGAGKDSSSDALRRAKEDAERASAAARHKTYALYGALGIIGAAVLGMGSYLLLRRRK